MTDNKIMKEIDLFKQWLADNTSAFNYKPLIVKDKPNNLELQFEGLTEKLICVVSQYFIDIWYLYDNEKIDLLYEIDMPMAENLISHKPPFIKRLTKLHANKAFNYLLEWINNIKPGDQVRILDGSEYGFFSAQLNKLRYRTYKGIEPIFLPLITS